MSTASFPETPGVDEFYEFYGSRERALDDFRSELESCHRVSQIDKRSFFLMERLAKWFRSPSSNHDGESKGTNAGRLLLIVSNSAELPNFVPTLLEHMADADNLCWLRIFAILLQLDLGHIDPDKSAGRAHLGHAKMLSRFFHSGLIDRKLPIGEDDLFKEIKNFGMDVGEAKDFAQRFWRLQWEFCTRDAFDNAYNRSYGFDKMILPICTIDTVKPGGSGRIFQIEVPVECIPGSLAGKITARPYRKDDPPGEYQQFALKVLDNREDYDQETFAYSAIERTDAMIVQCLGYWEYALSPVQTEYHLLLEWGLYDLDDHFALFAPPATGESILQFWKTLLGIFYALRQIHYLEVPHDNLKMKYYGWHGDIKPENLLYCEEGEKQGWKIGDPGFARFAKRDKAVVDGDGLPLTVIRGGTMTYGGPERSRDDSVPVSQRFDLWSLGCVLSEAATWIVLGNRGVHQFRHVRIQPMGSANTELSLDDSIDDLQGIDRFHNGTEVSHAVRDWHRYLRQGMRKCDPVTSLILDMVERSLLVASAKDRITSTELVRQMKKIIDAGEAQIAKNSYTTPKAFRVPFKVEQSKESAFLQQSWDVTTLNFETRKSVKYKSKRFIDATKDQLGNPPTDIASFVSSIPHFDEMTSQEADDRPAQGVQRRSQTMPKNSKFQPQKSGEGGALDMKRITSPGGSGQGSYLTFWDARKVLEKQGWVAGALELQEELLMRTPSPIRPAPGSPETETLPAQNSSSLDPISPSVKSSKSRKFSVESFTRKLRARRKGSTAGEESPQEKLPSLGTSQLTDMSLSASPSTRRLIEHRRAGSEDHRYTAINQYFDNRDVVFLVDNGSTMSEHWTFTKELLSVLVAFLYLQDDNGMELFFTSSKDSHGPFSQPRDFVDAMDKMSPRMPPEREKTMEPVKEETETDSTSAEDPLPGENDIREVLGHILGQWRSTYKRKLTLIILTDGVWPKIEWKRTVANRIVTFLETWDDKTELKKILRKRGLSIQFIQLGDDLDARAEFEYMDNSLTSSVGLKLPDIIDYEPADGNIRKMILGSITEEWDNDLATVTSDDAGNVFLDSEDKNGDMTDGGRPRLQPISPVAAGLETTFLGGAFESTASPLKSRPHSSTWARG